MEQSYDPKLASGCQVKLRTKFWADNCHAHGGPT